MDPKQIEIVDEKAATAHFLSSPVVLHSRTENAVTARLLHDGPAILCQHLVSVGGSSVLGTLRFIATVSY